MVPGYISEAVRPLRRGDIQQWNLVPEKDHFIRGTTRDPLVGCVHFYFIFLQYVLYLVGGLNPLKNMKVNWDDEIPNLDGKIQVMFQSPPTRNPLDSHFHPFSPSLSLLKSSQLPRGFPSRRTSTLLQRWCSRSTFSGSTAAALRLSGAAAVVQGELSKGWDYSVGMIWFMVFKYVNVNYHMFDGV